MFASSTPNRKGPTLKDDGEGLPPWPPGAPGADGSGAGDAPAVHSLGLEAL